MVHDLSSTMLYIHPPLAIMGYVLVVLAFLSTWLSRWEKPWAKRAELLALYAWLFTFLGLVSGMIWAQLAWGRFWGWDPKETATLVLFIAVFLRWWAGAERKNMRTRLYLSVLCVLLVAVAASSSWIVRGLHSYI